MGQRYAIALIALGGCAASSPGFYDAAPIEDAGLALCVWSRRYTPPIVYTESDFIRVYFEATDPATYRRAIPEPFTMPARPLVRVSVLDFYGMENGPLYRESEVSVLALHEGRPGWVVLTIDRKSVV